MSNIKIICATLLLAVAKVAPAHATAPESEVAAVSVQMIARGDHKIAFHVIKGSRATIVLDAGSGADSSYWRTLAPQLAKRTGFTVISYDRAGLGASDEVEGPWDVHAAVADLAHGLEALGATRNVILASHSLSGQIATYLTNSKPKWFAGAVLVDANLPEFFSDETMQHVQKEYDPIIARFEAAPSTRETRVFLALVASWAETNRAYHKVKWPSSVPVTVIVSETSPLRDSDSARRWHEAQAKFAKRGKNRTLVTATGSSHDVVRDRPDLVIDAIEKYAAAIR